MRKNGRGSPGKGGVSGRAAWYLEIASRDSIFSRYYAAEPKDPRRDFFAIQPIGAGLVRSHKALVHP